MKAGSDEFTEEQYLAHLHQQQGVCAICRWPAILHVDHDHKTGAVRGLLCRACNMRLLPLVERGYGLTEMIAALNYLDMAKQRERQRFSPGVEGCNLLPTPSGY